MSIYKTNRKTKPYGFRWREGGKHYSRSFKTKAEAVAFQGEVVGAKFSGTLKPANRGNQKFQQFALNWLENSTSRRESTSHRHLEILKLHVFPMIGEMQLNQISRANIQAMVKIWDKNGLMPRTIIRHLAVLKGVFNDAVASDLIDKTPVFKLDIPKPQKPHRRPLTIAEMADLFEALESKWHPHIYIAIATGMRWSELAGLKIKNFDWVAKELKVDHSKTLAGIRTIKLSQTSMKFINQHLAETGRNMSSENEPLFTSPEGKALNYSNFRNRVFKPACEKAGFPELQLHDLRRTAATLLTEAESPAKELQTLLGHSDIRTTLNLYAQSTDEGKKRIAAEMERLLKFIDEADDGKSETA